MKLKITFKFKNVNSTSCYVNETPKQYAWKKKKCIEEEYSGEKKTAIIVGGSNLSKQVRASLNRENKTSKAKKKKKRNATAILYEKIHFCKFKVCICKNIFSLRHSRCFSFNFFTFDLKYQNLEQLASLI